MEIEDNGWLIAHQEIESLKVQLAGERQARENLDRALRAKDAAMSVLFERMLVSGVDFSDLVP